MNYYQEKRIMKRYESSNESFDEHTHRIIGKFCRQYNIKILNKNGKPKKLKVLIEQIKRVRIEMQCRDYNIKTHTKKGKQRNIGGLVKQIKNAERAHEKITMFHAGGHFPGNRQI